MLIKKKERKRKNDKAKYTESRGISGNLLFGFLIVVIYLFTA
jgi:hypothetical protein